MTHDLALQPVGPISKRRCRDVFWLLLFAVFWVGMFVIAGFAYQVGDPFRLIYGIDYRGNLCGRPNANEDLSDRPYLYYFDISSPFNGTFMSPARSSRPCRHR